MTHFTNNSLGPCSLCQVRKAKSLPFPAHSKVHSSGGRRQGTELELVGNKRKIHKWYIVSLLNWDGLEMWSYRAWIILKYVSKTVNWKVWTRTFWGLENLIILSTFDCHANQWQHTILKTCYSCKCFLILYFLWFLKDKLWNMINLMFKWGDMF